MEYEDGSQYGEMLYDDRTQMSLAATTKQLELRATPYYFVRREYITKIHTINSPITKFPIHAVYFTKHNGAVIVCNGPKMMKTPILSVTKKAPLSRNMMKMATLQGIGTAKYGESRLWTEQDSSLPSLKIHRGFLKACA